MPMLTAAFAGFLTSIVVYFATRLIIKDKADNMIGGILVAFFIAPWWAALLGAIAGHTLSILVTHKIKKQKTADTVSHVLFGAVFIWCFVSMFTFLQVADDVDRIGNAELNAAWVQFSTKGVAEKFVADNYRPCVESNRYQYRFENIGRNASLCFSSTIVIAESTKDAAFGRQVSAAIETWKSSKKISRKGEVEIEKLIAKVS